MVPTSFHPLGKPGGRGESELRGGVPGTEQTPMNETGVIRKVFSEPQPIRKFTTLGTDFRIPRVILSLSVKPNSFLPYF